MKKIISRIAVLAIAVFVIYNIISFCTKTEETYVAKMKTIEITYDFDGVISRSEKIVSTHMAGTGWFEPSVSENEMVKNGKLVGVYYDGELDNETKTRLKEINSDIDELSMSSEELGKLRSSGEKIESDIALKKEELKEAFARRDLSKVNIIRSEIVHLLEKKASLESDEEIEPKTYEELNMEKEHIESENKINREEIYAPCHGVFATYLDGYEKTLTSDFALSMTVDDFKVLKKGNKQSDSEKEVNVCKIVDNSQWWVSLLASQKDAKNFKIGETVKIRISGDEKEISATVKYISPAKANEYIITLSSIASSEYIMQNRFMSVTVIKESYQGLEVPIKAVRVKDGKTGVYVRTDNATKFREIDVLYKNDKIAIVKSESTALNSNALLLYDEVLVN